MPEWCCFLSSSAKRCCLPFLPPSSFRLAWCCLFLPSSCLRLVGDAVSPSLLPSGAASCFLLALAPHNPPKKKEGEGRPTPRPRRKANPKPNKEGQPKNPRRKANPDPNNMEALPHLLLFLRGAAVRSSLLLGVAGFPPRVVSNTLVLDNHGCPLHSQETGRFHVCSHYCCASWLTLHTWFARLRPCLWSGQLLLLTQRKQRIAQSPCRPLEDFATCWCWWSACASGLAFRVACSVVGRSAQTGQTSQSGVERRRRPSNETRAVPVPRDNS